MDWRTSWLFPAKLFNSRRIIIRPVRLPLILAIEIPQREYSPYPSIFGHMEPDMLSLLELEGSVVWNIHADVVFLACRFAFHDKNPHVVQIALITDGGGTEMDTYVCPRSRIINYASDYHGLGEAELIGKMDEYAAYDSLRMRLQHKIVVGYNIHDQLKKLKIDLTELAGVREIKTNSCFGTQSMSKYSFSLQHLASVFLKRPMGHPITDAHVEAIIVRGLYLHKEREWIDDNAKTADSWRAWVLNNPVIQPAIEKECEATPDKIRDLFEELPNDYSENPELRLLENLFAGCPMDLDETYTPFQSCTSEMDDHERSEAANNQEDDEPIFNGETAPTHNIKEEPQLQSNPTKINFSEQLENARETDKLFSNEEKTSIKANGFWIQSATSNLTHIHNRRATDIDKGGLFFPQCPIWVQFVKDQDFQRLPYRNIPNLDDDWTEDYFEVFYTPKHLEYYPVSEWYNNGDEIYREGRDSKRLLMPPPKTNQCQEISVQSSTELTS